MRPTLPLTLLALSLSACANAPIQAGAPAAKAPTTQEVIDASTAADWRPLDPVNTVYLQLPSGMVVIELAPEFAPEHTANIRTLVKGRYFDGLSVNRSQDNFVVQWGDPAGDELALRRPLGEARATLPAEFSRAADGLDFHALPDPDGWAPQTGFVNGFAAARDPKAGKAWLAHCYGTVGAGRAMEPDSSNGSELYVVTGQSPRQLDLNITTVGRVVVGMERLSVLPRGSGPLGFYTDASQRVPILAVRLASEIEPDQRAQIEVMRTGTPTWDAYVESRRNRSDEWYLHPAGHIDVCNLSVPVRPIPKPAAAG
ncbi:peptidyl-prolyl cis-trans isomerase [Arenimonas soli]|uniref:peptidylprolyl isomerase n=1 Tax=Arenimonas soli TaxID=2269504 RepID=A0ABQ1HBT5_9GAMM|nr:peptidylprolyl isomerase [Arenimonas soli]GGA70062.1 peptidyl-prolyl cis-trans isomerase [Arenimonas soli]